MKTLIGAITVAITGFWVTNAQAVLIDFDNVTPGDVGVTITDTVGGGGCIVANYGTQGDGLSCAISSDTDGSKAQIDLGMTAQAISLDYGNDDPGFTVAGDLAIIEVWLGGALVDTVTQILNRDDIMNQTIGFAGALFDQAFFYFGRAVGDPFTGGPDTATGLAEVFDNINITEAKAVPEPGTLALLGLGLGIMGLRIGKKR